MTLSCLLRYRLMTCELPIGQGKPGGAAIATEFAGRFSTPPGDAAGTCCFYDAGMIWVGASSLEESQIGIREGGEVRKYLRERGRRDAELIEEAKYGAYRGLCADRLCAQPTAPAPATQAGPASAKKGRAQRTPRPAPSLQARSLSRQPPCCMCIRIFSPISFMRTSRFSSASRTTTFCCGVNVA